MTIYAVRYTHHKEPVGEFFQKEKQARDRYAQLYREQRAGAEIEELEIERDEIMRPSIDTILRILNQQPYVLKRVTILK